MCEQVASAHHLLLDTEALSIANAKMKTQQNFIGFVIIGLLTQYGLAERGHEHSYLPPAVQNAITEEIITIEEHGSSGQTQFDESRYGGGKYQIYEVHHHYAPESENALSQTDFNSPGYLPPAQNIHVQHVQKPQKKGARHLDIPSAVSQPLVSKLNVIPNEQILSFEQFDISQLNNVKGRKSAFRAADYLPPHRGNGVVSSQQSNPGLLTTTQHFKGPDYLPPHEQYSTNFNHQEPHKAVEQSRYKGPDYLPPHQTNYQQSQSGGQLNIQKNNALKGPEYLPPHQSEEHLHNHEAHEHVIQAGEFKSPEYLPPHRTSSQHSQHNIQESHQFKGPDYLPPHQSSSLQIQQQVQHHVHQDVQQSGQFKGPDYLPPHKTSPEQIQHQPQQHVEQHVQQIEQYKGPDYLPPHTNEQHVHHHHHHHIDGQHQIQQANQYKGPDYLPPHNEHQTANHVGTQQNQFKGPDYLPPHEEHPNQYQSPNYQELQHTQSHQNQYQQVQQSGQFRAPDYLPPHKGTNQPGTLPPGYEFSNPDVPLSVSQPQIQQPIQQPIQQAYQPQPLLGAAELPPGYDFEKPENAEEAIAELHTLPKEDHQEFVVQSQIQVKQNEEHSQVYSGQQQSGINYQSNAYLPPHQIPQQTPTNYQVPLSNIQTTFNGQQNIKSNIQQTSPQIFTATPSNTAAEAPVSNYLPPARPVQAEQYSTNLHSLSSFMNSVQPNVRYGVAQFTAPRQPFREYGPPSANVAIGNNDATQHRQQQQYQLPVVSPMYRDQASRPPYYAPAMSYTTNSLANSYTTTTAAHQQTHHQHYASFNQQTRHNLQQFMPQDVRQYNQNHYSNSLPAKATAKGSPIVPPAPAVSARQTSSSRVRTVQILNPSTTKTLKVLETLDQAGVKTIKILGPSNTHPTGEHHIVKVISQSANSPHEQVQTVKIFNDHQDTSNIGSNEYLPPYVRCVLMIVEDLDHLYLFMVKIFNDHQDTSNIGSNEYLPPLSRVLRQSFSNRKQRIPFTGRRRYRH